jgi:hypothetical protein
VSDASYGHCNPKSLQTKVKLTELFLLNTTIFRFLNYPFVRNLPITYQLLYLLYPPTFNDTLSFEVIFKHIKGLWKLHMGEKCIHNTFDEVIERITSRSFSHKPRQSSHKKTQTEKNAFVKSVTGHSFEYRITKISDHLNMRKKL